MCLQSYDERSYLNLGGRVGICYLFLSDCVAILIQKVEPTLFFLCCFLPALQESARASAIRTLVEWRWSCQPLLEPNGTANK